VGRPARRYAESPAARKIIMAQTPDLQSIPEKCCMITIMFIPESDNEAIAIKAKVDEALKGIETKRYSFNLEQRTK